MANREWVRPTDTLDARVQMVNFERTGDYEGAALAALALADLTAGKAPEDAAAYERHAAVYAALHQAQTALFIAEERQPANYGLLG